jgi:hypothetical protein
MIRPRRPGWALLSLLAMGLTACGWGAQAGEGEARAVLVRAQQSLDERRSGQIEFSMTASAEEGEPVGFEVEGEYSFEEGRELAVLDLEYRQILGEESVKTRVVSTGERAWAVNEETTTELDADQRAVLRVDQAETATPVTSLDLEGWLVDGTAVAKGGRTTVEGEIRASAMVEDVQELAAQMAGAASGDMDADTAEQIDRAVERSEMTLATEGDEFRSLKATVEFGASVPPALRRALGRYAGATLELTVRVADVNTPLEIDPPE